MRDTLRQRGLGLDARFRWRGGEVTRLEGFSDAVFAFAVTLLVVSLEVPDTFAELRATLFSFVAFGICFAVLILLWYQHYVFFRRYGLEDTPILWLNSVLLFLVLFYIYPLKFLVGFVLDLLVGFEATVADLPFEGPEEVVQLMIVYAGGYASVWLLFALMYRHAYRLRDALELTREEVLLTRGHVGGCLIQAGVAAASVALVVLLPPSGRTYFLAGSVYWLLGPLLWLLGRTVERQIAGGTSTRGVPSSAAR